MGAENRWTGNVILDGAILGSLKRTVKKLSPTLTSQVGELDTSWDLPSTALVRDVFVYVNTAEATSSTKTLDVGLLSTESGGDADGFANDVSVAATGLVRPTFTTSDGSGITFLLSTTRGVLLSKFVAGSDGGAGQSPGIYIEKPHIASSLTAKSVSVTPGDSDWAEANVDIYVVYDEVVTV